MLLLALLLFTNACIQGQARVPFYVMNVDSIAGSGATKARTYFLIPGLQGVSSRSLLFREFAAQTGRALKYRGYVRASNADEADVVILLSYGIGEPKVEYELISSPVTPSFGASFENSPYDLGGLNPYGSGTTWATHFYYGGSGSPACP